MQSENGGSNFTSSFAMTLSLGSYLIVLFCGISIQLHIRRRYRGPSMVVKRRVNHQITVVLVAQVTGKGEMRRFQLYFEDVDNAIAFYRRSTILN
jgi:hypothetical protein